MTLLSGRAQIKPSATVSLLDQVRELKRAGQEVISLSADEPDFVTPEHYPGLR
jgi:aspartate aminotransferase